jgi:murein DD-endopeptidase MepM/ murein hydrolase activator NlpD
VSNPLPGYEVTTPYGVRGSWAAGYHTGDDYSTHGKTGVPVRPSRKGRVVEVGEPWGPAYGLTLVMEGRLKRVRVGYCHLSSVRVHVGDVVGPATVVAYTGRSADGPSSTDRVAGHVSTTEGHRHLQPCLSGSVPTRETEGMVITDG